MEIVILIVAVLILAETSFLAARKLREKRLKVARGSLLLDTSAIMDGRIVEVAKSGIITAEVIIPRSVIREMQLLADKADSDKRARARQGLENVRELEKLGTINVNVINDGYVDSGGVDERLLTLAKNYDASICTTDFNLNKVAKTLDITVVNVNELAQNLRAVVLPGETVEIQLVQPGANREQAVGYLDDGTMVVVEDAKNLIGQKLKVEIVRSLQTEAGRMMFAKKIAGHLNPTNNFAKSSASYFAKKNTAKIKPAPAFHSDQIKNERLSAKRFSRNNNQKNHLRTGNQNQSPAHSQSAEDSMVALANRK